MFFKGLVKILHFIFQGVLNVFGVVASGLISVFPPSPFSVIDKSGYSYILSKINFFVPFYELISIMESWLIVISIFYLYSLIARWVKAIE